MARLHLISDGPRAPCGALLSDGHTHEPPKNWATRSAFGQGHPPAGWTWCEGCAGALRERARTGR